MRITFLLILTIGLASVFLNSTVSAEDEQWLQYCWSSDEGQIPGREGSRFFELDSKPPAGVELPEFKGKEPLFVRWESPMAKGGGLWIAVDNTGKYGSYDRLFIDSDGDGSLKDETAMSAVTENEYQSRFGPAKVVFEGDDGPITYHLSFELYIYDSRSRYLYIHPACWYEGTIIIGGAKKQCTLIDRNVNGTFNDKSIHVSQCDQIGIGSKDARNTTCVGNLLQIDDQLYNCQIARDGAFVKLTRAEDVKFGDIVVPKTITRLNVCGENGFFSVFLEDGAGKLPTGKYLIDNWQIERKDPNNNKWLLTGSGFSENASFTVTETGKANLDIGEPAFSALDVNKRGAQYIFNLRMRGRGGETIELMFNNTRAREPKLVFNSKDGKFNKSFALRYG
jgi:hypothetical protein